MMPEITIAATERNMLKPNMKHFVNCTHGAEPMPTSSARRSHEADRRRQEGGDAS